MKKKIFIIVLLIAICIIGFRLFNIYEKILERLYPMDFSEYVDEYSEKYEVEREWIFALIKAESNFDKNSVSSSGAVGLMQLMENTAEEMAQNTRNRRNKLKGSGYKYRTWNKIFFCPCKIL